MQANTGASGKSNGGLATDHRNSVVDRLIPQVRPPIDFTMPASSALLPLTRGQRPARLPFPRAAIPTTRSMGFYKAPCRWLGGPREGLANGSRDERVTRRTGHATDGARLRAFEVANCRREPARRMGRPLRPAGDRQFTRSATGEQERRSGTQRASAGRNPPFNFRVVVGRRKGHADGTDQLASRDRLAEHVGSQGR